MPANDAALADWWEDFAPGSDDDRQALLAEVRATQQQRPRRQGRPAWHHRRRYGSRWAQCGPSGGRR